MEPRRQKAAARIALLVLAVAGLVWIARLDFRAKISTNVIDLIPREERSPELALVRSFATEQQARSMLFALQGDAGGRASPEATSAFVSTLRDSGLFAEIADLNDAGLRDALGRFVFERRLDLLLPTWLHRKHQEFSATARPPGDFSPWLAEQTAGALDAFLARPESVAFQDLVPHDPLLLLPTLADRTRSLQSGGTTKASLVWALLKPSPFSEEGQEPVFRVIEQARAAAVSVAPGVRLQWTGINRFAAASRSRITAELSLLNTASLLAVVAVACVFVRRLWKVLHLVPVILYSILGAWVATTVAFERVHTLVFVVGSLLAGVAVDYGFYLYMQPALRPDEPYREKVRRLLRPLLASCLTTVLGFSFLLFSELPLIQQLGVFVSAGLLSALLAALLYFAQLDRPFLEVRTLPRPEGRHARLAGRALGVAFAAVAAFGLFRLSWRDDIRDLDIPAPDLRANDLAVRSLFGDSADRTLYITRGTSMAEARDSLEHFLAWHDERHPDAPGASVGLLIPSEPSVQALPARLQQLAGFESDLSRALEAKGYGVESFEPFLSAWRHRLEQADTPPPLEALAGEVLRHLTGPAQLLWHARPGDVWFLTAAEHPQSVSPPADTGTFPVAQLESLNTLFSRYRQSALRLSSLGLALVGLSVFVLYGFARGVRIFLIPAGSCLLAFGVLGAMGQPLNLFHLLGAFLGVCLSHNYAIFSAENAGRREPPPPSIRLSALTTAASFGALAFSSIPVVAALGTIVATTVLIALLMVELEPLSPARKRGQDHGG